MSNADDPTLRAFDEKWAAHWRGVSSRTHQQRTFDNFFSLFPFEELSKAEGFDLGCGNGRHAEKVAPRVGRLHCIDPSPAGLAAARAQMADQANVEFHCADVDHIPLPDASQDFGYSMGVLHHIPDTEGALRRCTAKLRPGAPFLLYLYYAFDNRPAWFRAVWRGSDLLRRLICRLPIGPRKRVCDIIAVTIYWPLSRLAGEAERRGVSAGHWPLSYYRRTPLVSLKVSSLDRFGTPLEQRFSRRKIEAMMRRCGLEDVRFQEHEPYWVALGRKR
ncbi:class I SAM-dependent methyltransferase [Sphingomonas ginkgonis]|uniref:Class I SAM-dependent methyltransferase n=1 Tax=Sphingomonas ginkgonis TaxID=2315330 RepID=A0A3R9WN79_9SPHN|nr:class I SAM-dependent methyltransferase [Sphingomonas ginkgonis]RST30390.1 class I SAM-dependent methyltransferase [Sphingomonas ginkgonis]